MIDTFQIFEELKESLPEDVARKLASIVGKIYSELANMVTREDFSELKKAVQSLAEAQQRTEQEVAELRVTVKELAEAQKRSEERLTRFEKAVEELAEAQKRTEEEIRKLSLACGITSVENIFRRKVFSFILTLSMRLPFGDKSERWVIENRQDK